MKHVYGKHRRCVCAAETSRSCKNVCFRHYHLGKTSSSKHNKISSHNYFVEYSSQFQRAKQNKTQKSKQEHILFSARPIWDGTSKRCIFVPAVFELTAPLRVHHLLCNQFYSDWWSRELFERIYFVQKFSKWEAPKTLQFCPLPQSETSRCLWGPFYVLGHLNLSNSNIKLLWPCCWVETKCLLQTQRVTIWF